MSRPKRRSVRADVRPLEEARIERADPALCARLFAGGVLRWRRSIPRVAPLAVAGLFERDLDRSPSAGPRVVLDPCCGNGVVLAVLQVAYPGLVRELHGADADPAALRFTESNLAILNDRDTLRERIVTLEGRRDATGNPRFDAAIADARCLEELDWSGRPTVAVSRIDALADPWPASGVDLVLADPPYGRRSGWLGSDIDGDEGLVRFLQRARDAIAADGAVGLFLDPAVRLPEVEGLRVVDRVALERRAGWLLAR